VKTEDRLQLKFRLLVSEVEKRMSYKLDMPIGKDIEELDFSDTSPLRLVFPEYVHNPYIKFLVSKVSTVLPQKNKVAETWFAKCEGSGTFLNMQKRMELAGIYLQMHSFKRGSFYSFLFWGMVGIVVNNKDEFDDKLSLLVDFAHVFAMSEEEILDISQVAKAFYGEYNKGFKFKTAEIEGVLGTVYSFLITPITG